MSAHNPRFTCQGCGKRGYGAIKRGNVHRPQGWTSGFVCVDCQENPRPKARRGTMDHGMSTRRSSARKGGEM